MTLALPNLNQQSSTLKVEMFDAFPDGTDFRHQWDQCIERVGGDIYMTFDWSCVWWKHYGRGRMLRIFIGFDDSGMVGIFPAFVETLGRWPFYFRWAKLVGSDHAMTLCNPPVDPVYGRQILEYAFTHLRVQDRCDTLWLGPLSGESTVRNAIDSIYRAKANRFVVIRDGIYGPHTVFNLPDRMDRYLRSLSPNQRSNYRRNVNRLIEKTGFRVDVVCGGDELEEAFEHFIDMHARQWQAVGRAGHFADWPGALSFNHEMIRSQARQGRLMLVRLWVDETIAAYQWCYRFADRVYWRLPARRVGEPWDRLGLGRMGIMTMIETAITQGANRIEAGLGHYAYKEHLGCREYGARSILLAADRPVSRWKTRLLAFASRWVHLLYYRIWFNKLTVRLNRPRRPLWRTWIRLRI